MDKSNLRKMPKMDGPTGLNVLRQMLQERSILAGLTGMHAHLGNVFQITLPSFNPVVLTGPEANRHVLVTNKDDFLWRNEADPVTRLLGHGLLVEDGKAHDALRELVEPVLQRKNVTRFVESMWRGTHRLTQRWEDGGTVDMLVEMRKVALVILMENLFAVDIAPDLPQLWKPILRAIAFISPGPWLIWPDIPRTGYAKPLKLLDDYLFNIIRSRRIRVEAGLDEFGDESDLLTQLVANPMLTDELIRDQMLTLLIAGHDTSTALLAWVFYLLGSHPEALAKAEAEARTMLSGSPPGSEVLNQLKYIDMVIKETLRLYPPIHAGNRRTTQDMEINGCTIAEDSRVMVSIYLSHRDPQHWRDPNNFLPERFDRSAYATPPSLTYIPFGGGPRNCVGAAFSQIEAKVVLGQILSEFDLSLLPVKVHPHMGATLEPRPGVWMKVRRRSEAR